MCRCSRRYCRGFKIEKFILLLQNISFSLVALYFLLLGMIAYFSSHASKSSLPIPLIPVPYILNIIIGAGVLVLPLSFTFPSQIVPQDHCRYWLLCCHLSKKVSLPHNLYSLVAFSYFGASCFDHCRNCFSK